MTGNRERSNLERIEPKQAVQMYLNDRETELADSSIQSHTYRLERFLDWCKQEQVNDMNELTGRDVQAYKIHRRKQDIAKTTLKAQLDTFRVFLQFCERINAVVDGLSNDVDTPNIGKKEGRRDDIVNTDKAQEILQYWEQFHYASVKHTLFQLLWKTGIRLGSVRALDVEDFDGAEKYIHIVHRDTTPLKNQENGERLISLSNHTTQVIEDYIQNNRIEQTQKGRKPLFTTRNGRISKNCLRSYIYQMTRPCLYQDSCPHSKNVNNCQAKTKNVYAYDCPSSTSTHSVRRGSITHHLREDIPEKVVSDRMDVTQEVLEKHYDSRSEKQKMEQRREFLESN